METVKKAAVARAEGEERNEWAAHTGLVGQWSTCDTTVIQAGSAREASILCCQLCCEPQML